MSDFSDGNKLEKKHRELVHSENMKVVRSLIVSRLLCTDTQHQEEAYIYIYSCCAPRHRAYPVPS